MLALSENIGPLFPKITLRIGASFGAGEYGMAGRSYDPRFLFSWPNAKMSVMGGEQAARTMAQVALEGAERKGQDPKKIYGENLEMLEGMKQKIIDQYREEGEAIFCSARLWDDGIIDPRDTRKVIIQALNAVQNSPIQDPKLPVFRM